MNALNHLGSTAVTLIIVVVLYLIFSPPSWVTALVAFGVLLAMHIVPLWAAALAALIVWRFL